MSAVVEPALVGGSQAATDFVNARNAQLGIAAGGGTVLLFRVYGSAFSVQRLGFRV